MSETEWFIQRLLVLYCFRGLSSCHNTVKDRKQIVGSTEWGMRDWKEKGWISSGSLACAIADEHSWNVFEELGWHPAKRLRERGTSRKQSERGRESEVESRTERSTSRQRDWALVKQTDHIQISILWHFALLPSDLYRCPPGTLHAPGQQPTPWLSPAGSTSSSNITRRWVRTESVAFFYSNSDFSSFSVRSGV